MKDRDRQPKEGPNNSSRVATPLRHIKVYEARWVPRSTEGPGRRAK